MAEENIPPQSNNSQNVSVWSWKQFIAITIVFLILYAVGAFYSVIYLLGNAVGCAISMGCSETAIGVWIALLVVISPFIVFPLYAIYVGKRLPTQIVSRKRKVQWFIGLLPLLIVLGYIAYFKIWYIGEKILTIPHNNNLQRQYEVGKQADFKVQLSNLETSVSSAREMEFSFDMDITNVPAEMDRYQVEVVGVNGRRKNGDVLTPGIVYANSSITFAWKKDGVWEYQPNYEYNVRTPQIAKVTGRITDTADQVTTITPTELIFQFSIPEETLNSTYEALLPDWKLKQVSVPINFIRE